MEKVYQFPPDQIPSSMRDQHGWKNRAEFWIKLFVSMIPAIILVSLAPPSWNPILIAVLGAILPLVIILLPLFLDLANWERKAGSLLPDSQWILAEESLTFHNKSLEQRLAIERSQVQSIVEFPEYLRVTSKNGFITIPRSVGDYYDLRDHLSAWTTIQPAIEKPFSPTPKQILGGLAGLGLVVGTPLLVVVNFFVWDLIPTLIISLLAISGSILLIRIMRKTRDAVGSKPVREFTKSYVIYILATIVKLGILIARLIG